MTNRFRIALITTAALALPALAQQTGVWTAAGGVGSDTLCSAAFTGGHKTFKLQTDQINQTADGKFVDPKVNAAMQPCMALQKREIRTFCSRLQSAEYSRYLSDIEKSGLPFSDYIAIKPEWNIRGFANDPKFRRAKSDRDLFNDFMRLHDMPSGESENLFNAAFDSTNGRLMTVAGLVRGRNVNPQKNCVDERTGTTCECAKADALLAFVKMYANSARVRRALADKHLAPPFRGREGDVRAADVNFGTADAREQPTQNYLMHGN